MSEFFESIWLNVSPSFQAFHLPLIQTLSQQSVIKLWEYYQTPDESTSLEIALVLLHDYLKSSDRPVHLIGHSLSGWLGILYAHRYPERVKSLTLLAVGVNPTIDWQAHYYLMLQKFPCNRQIILNQMVQSLFGHQCVKATQKLMKLLEEDLWSSPSPHPLFHELNMTRMEVPVPLLVCGSKDDTVVSSSELQAWQPWLKKEDNLWECSQGRHFFHYWNFQQVSQQILSFRQDLSFPRNVTLMSNFHS